MRAVGIQMDILDWFKVVSLIKLRKSRALFIFLSLSPNRPHRTEKLIDLLWQDSEPQKSSSSFRQAVRQIRVGINQFHGVHLDTQPGVLVLNLPGNEAWDARFFSELKFKDWESRYRNLALDLFARMDSVNGISESLDSWVTISVSRLQSVLRDALEHQLSREHSRSNRLVIAEFALELDPTNEFATRFLMRWHWEQGDPTRSIGIYNALYHLLDNELDQEPAPETIALLAAIKLEPSRVTPSEQIKSALPPVVLCLQVKKPSFSKPEADGLLDVLTSDFKMRLSRFREWAVVEKDAKNPSLANVIVSLQQLGSSQRLLVELYQSEDGRLLWSEFITDPLVDWEAKVRPVFINIANALSLIVSGGIGQTMSAGTYREWLEAQVLLDQWSPETEGTAIDKLIKITTSSPGFGPAHAELAGALNVRHILLPGTFQTHEIKEQAVHHALEAVTLDPMDTRAHRVLAWCFCHKEEFSLAEFHFDQALELNPQNQLTIVSAALGFAFMASDSRARELLDHARSEPRLLEPFHLVYLAAIDYLLGDYESAVSLCKETQGFMPTVGGWHTVALHKLGEVGPARARFIEYLEETRALWKGQAALTTESLIHWFTSIFPLRYESTRIDLRDTLEGATQIETTA